MLKERDASGGRSRRCKIFSRSSTRSPGSDPRPGRVDRESRPAQRANRPCHEPPVHARAVVTVPASRQHLHFLAVFEHPKAYAAFTGSLHPRRRAAVQDDGQPVDGGSVEAWQGPRRAHVRRTAAVRSLGRQAVVAADPARVEEEDGDEADDAKQHDDVEEGVALDLDLDVVVVELCVPPLEQLRVLRSHGGGRDGC